MKKIMIAALALLMSLSFTACKDKTEAEKAPEAAKEDWRNTIQYENSFFVNDSKRLLYALDTGKITLWDNDGNGSVLQTIEYDTSVADAIERIEKEDFNMDGNCDIRIIYHESEKGTRYRLWLWNTLSSTFSECKLYSSLTNPVYEDGKVKSIEDMGYFGTLRREYVFNSTLGLDEVSITIDNAEGIAQKIANDTCGGTVEKLEFAQTIGNEECTLYIAKDGTYDVGYIAHTDDSVWYIDDGCRGFYQTLESKDGALATGAYIGDAGTCAKIAENFGEGEITVMRRKDGLMGEVNAHRYSVSIDTTVIFIATDTAHNWYVSEDGVTYRRYSSSKNEYMGEETYEFTVPQEEPIYGDPIM